MVLRKTNNLVVIFIIICSTSFYKFSFLGRMDKVAELIGVGLIVFSIILFFVYSKRLDQPIRRNFVTPILLILISLIPSMLVANTEHGQSFGFTMYAQRALYYYMLYFLLHQMKIEIKDLERIFFGLGFFYVFLYYLQVVLYPNIIFDAYVRAARGTIRIYLSGSDYMAISLFMSVQYFLRTNKIKYLIYSLLFFSIFVLMGGRQMMAIVVFAIALFVLFDRKVKSRSFLIFLGLVLATAVYFMFQEIFEALLVQSQKDTSTSEGYVRFRAAKFFLTEFMDNSWTYVAGNGRSYPNSRYGSEIRFYADNYGYYLGDIGLIGNYVVYGALFVAGVIAICFRSLKLKIEEEYVYIKYMILTIVLAMITSAGFTKADAISFMMILLYIIDRSVDNVRNPVSQIKLQEENKST